MTIDKHMATEFAALAEASGELSVEEVKLLYSLRRGEWGIPLNREQDIIGSGRATTRTLESLCERGFLSRPRGKRRSRWTTIKAQIALGEKPCRHRWTAYGG